ncbi:hypothetical protein AB9M62_12105 [Bacillales bacterium AN1005]
MQKFLIFDQLHAYSTGNYGAEIAIFKTLIKEGKSIILITHN